MGLNLSAEDIAALETRTEGWIAGLQLAALSMQGHQDATSFIKSFTGSHHFVLDYLVEEVLQQQSESVQTFLLRTSILDRLCGPLCDAVLLDPVCFRARNPGISRTRQPVHRPPGQRAALVPLSPSLRRFAAAAAAPEHRLVYRGCRRGVAELHIRASQWYEDNGLEIEAFQHAAAANDVERAERLIEGQGDAPALSRRGGPSTELAGVAANDGTGCQALVVGDVCLVAADVRPDRPASKRNSRRLKQPCKTPIPTTRPAT